MLSSPKPGDSVGVRSFLRRGPRCTLRRPDCHRQDRSEEPQYTPADAEVSGGSRVVPRNLEALCQEDPAATLSSCSYDGGMPREMIEGGRQNSQVGGVGSNGDHTRLRPRSWATSQGGTVPSTGRRSDIPASPRWGAAPLDDRRARQVPMPFRTAHGSGWPGHVVAPEGTGQVLRSFDG